MIQRYFLFISIFIITIFLLFTGCGRNNKTSTVDKPWYHEDDFKQDYTIHAKLNTPVILDLDPQGTQIHFVRYFYEESGEYMFCIDPNEKHIIAMTLFDKNKNTVLSLEKEDSCKSLYIDAGRYSMQITHDTSKIPENGTVAFISSIFNSKIKDFKSEKNISDDAYYVVQVEGGSHDGECLGVTGLNYGCEDYYLGVFLPKAYSQDYCEDFTFEQKDGKLVLKGFTWISHYAQWCTVGYPEDYFCVDSQIDAFGSYNVFSTNNCNYSYAIDLYLKTDANNTHTLWTEKGNDILESSLYVAENNLLYTTSTTKKPTNPTYFTLPNIRWYQYDSNYLLRENEVAIYEECNISDGRMYVIDGDISNTIFVQLPQIASIKFGKNVSNIIFFKKENYQDWSVTLDTNSQGCFEKPINMNTIGSMKILNAKKVFISSQQCDYCDLRGADFSNMTLDNVSLVSANLTNVKFNNSVMERAKMCNAILHGANLNLANLNGSAFYGAFLNGDSNNRINGASLNGAYLKNVNLAGADLSGASFKNANFYSDTVGLCTPTDCSYTTCASAISATLNSTNFNNAYLTGVDFTNADIYSSDFTNTVLVGAKFIKATITKDNKISSMTSFSGAYLQGVDFSDAVVDNTDFTNAYVDLNHTLGRVMLFNLNPGHTEFAAWETPGNICTMYAYTTPTITPQLDRSSFCPDGNNGGCNASVWNNPGLPMDQAVQAGSYYPSPNPACDTADINLNW